MQLNSCKSHFLLVLLTYKYGSWWHMFESVAIWNGTSLTCERKTNLSHNKKPNTFVSLNQRMRHTFYPVFLVWTKPVTSSSQWISGITDHYITVDKGLQEMNRCMAIVIDIYSFIHICIWKKTNPKASGLSCWNYLATQVIFVFSEGKHQDLKTFEVRRILNSVISPNRMEDHLIRVHWVYTPERKRESLN